MRLIKLLSSINDNDHQSINDDVFYSANDAFLAIPPKFAPSKVSLHTVSPHMIKNLLISALLDQTILLNLLYICNNLLLKIMNNE